LVEDLQDKLEEARAEIAQRRKDEKELKGKDRAQIIQISGVSCAPKVYVRRMPRWNR
jgi:hypothetical protein